MFLQWSCHYWQLLLQLNGELDTTFPGTHLKPSRHIATPIKRKTTDFRPKSKLFSVDSDVQGDVI